MKETINATKTMKGLLTFTKTDKETGKVKSIIKDHNLIVNNAKVLLRDMVLTTIPLYLYIGDMNITNGQINSQQVQPTDSQMVNILASYLTTPQAVLVNQTPAIQIQQTLSTQSPIPLDIYEVGIGALNTQYKFYLMAKYNRTYPIQLDNSEDLITQYQILY